MTLQHKTVDQVLAEPGLSAEVARSMLAAVITGHASDVSKYLWMRLLNEYIAMVDPSQSVGADATTTDQPDRIGPESSGRDAQR